MYFLIENSIFLTVSKTVFFYASYILDVFGKLDYERLLEKAKNERVGSQLPSLPHYFLTADILELTKITAPNWFGKVQEIHETLPRIYGKLFFDPSASVI